MGSATFLSTGALTARISSDPRGIVEAPASTFGPGIVVHLGQSVEMACHRGGFSHRGLSVIAEKGITTRFMNKWTPTPYTTPDNNARSMTNGSQRLAM
jgi:hypothetical protein